MIQNRDVKLVSADGKRAQVEIHNDWLIDNKKMMEETDEVGVAERDGVYVIDLSYRFAPVVEYVLSQTAFGGFVVQAQKYGDSYYSTASARSISAVRIIPIPTQTGRRSHRTIHHPPQERR